MVYASYTVDGHSVLLQETKIMLNTLLSGANVSGHLPLEAVMHELAEHHGARATCRW